MTVLGRAAPAANTYVAVYTADVKRTVDIRCINRDLGAALALRLAVARPGWTAPTVPATDEWIEPPDYIMKPAGNLLETGTILEAGEVVVAFANTDKLTVRVCGF